MPTSCRFRSYDSPLADVKRWLPVKFFIEHLKLSNYTFDVGNKDF